MTLLERWQAETHWSNPQRIREATMATALEKLAAIKEAEQTLVTAALDLEPRIRELERRQAAAWTVEGGRMLIALRSLFATYETHAKALAKLRAAPPNPFRTAEQNAAQLERNIALNMSALGLCETRHEKAFPELAAPLHRAVWGLNRAFSPT